MTQPSLGEYAMVFEAIRRYRPYHDSFHSVFDNLLDSIGDPEARLLARSISDLMPLLTSDIHCLRFTADLLVRLDMYESTSAVLTAAVQTRDHQLMLSAASLAGNPAVETAVKDRIRAYTDNDRAVLIRLSPDIVPSSQEERWLHLQCWPGARTADMPIRLAPVVVLDTELPPANAFRLAVALERNGATIRRLDASAPIPPWFGNQTALVGLPSNQHIIHSKVSSLHSSRIFIDDLNYRKLDQLERLADRIYKTIPSVKKVEELQLI